jgi:pyruvate ferredoxin oxidoreductase gamma subunit
MYRIRFHGRGGQGMKTAGHILGTAFFHEGFEVQDAPRYGAERRGAPIFAYVRASRRPISARGIIRRPDLVVVADETLVPSPAAGVLAGVGPRTVLLLRSLEGPNVWKDRLRIPQTIVTLPPPEAGEEADMGYVGATCAGAAARVVGVISRASLEQAIRDEIEQWGAEVVAKNLDLALAAYERMEPHAGVVAESEELPPGLGESPGWVALPLEEAGVSAPAVFAAATSVEVRTGLWRTMRPVIDYDRCHKCAWICGSFCPDSAISVDAAGFPQIDYDHCKGCMICVAQCPHHVIEAGPERVAAEAEAEAKLEAESAGGE